MNQLDEGRPTGDEMLARVTAEERRSRGRLRLYMGMAPGVGKTYRMLEEGHRRLERGTDVVVGYVEVHGRPRTQALLEGLEILPRLQVEYRGVTVEEMDTDGGHRAPPRGGPDRRAGAHERARVAAREALAGRGAHPRCRDRRHQHLQRAAPGVGRGRRRHDRRRAGQRAPPGPLRGGGGRGRAGRHEPPRPAPAHPPRQRLSAGARPAGPRPLLHRAQPDGPARAGAAVRHPCGRRAAGRHRLRAGHGAAPTGQ